MKWTYRVLRVSGIDIKVHLSFVLIIFFFAVQWGAVHGTTGAVFGAVLILALFACVTLHELGHSLAAQYFGIPVREIILLPLGGLALLERTPTRPVQELVIALAGPLVNVLIIMVLLPIIALTGELDLLTGTAMLQGLNAQPSLGTLLTWLFEANILLVLFNMIPAFPLDGGRVLRSILAMFLGFRRATGIANSLGRGFALFLGVVGVFSFDVFLILIAIFIYVGASQEYTQEHANTVLSTRRVGDAYNKHVLTLSVGDRVHKVIDYILTSYQPDFAVVQGGRLLGIITRDDMLRTLSRSKTDTYVPDVYITAIMQREVVRVEASATLEEVRNLLNGNGQRVAAVYEDDTFLGLINSDDIAEAFTVLTFVERYHRQNQPPEGAQESLPGETSTSG
jgi:Zn-dependent protease